MKIKSTAVILFFIAFCLHTSVSAQELLNRKISIEQDKISIENLLKEIEEKADLSFSYNPDNLATDSIIEVSFKDQEVDSILRKSLGLGFEFKQNHKHIIIIKSKVKTEKETSETIYQKLPEDFKNKYNISGIIYDSETNTPITNTEIVIEHYDSYSSNEKGFYKIELSDDRPVISIIVRKEEYLERAIVAEPGASDINVSLTRRVQPVKVASGPMEPEIQFKRNINDHLITKALVPKEQRESKKEVKRKAFQLSFLPMVGTNHIESGNYTNDISLNIIAGYSSGVNSIELGGFTNIVRNQVNGIQGAGFANIVGGNVNGVQGAGFYNQSKNINGVQGSGFANVALGNITGVQGAGFANVALGQHNIGQGAGFANYAENHVQIQGAGFMNIAEHVSGIQGAGFMNIADKAHALQGAGFMNIADTVYGMQGAGFMNIAGEAKALQASGFMNIADNIKGAQLSGFINFADNVKGVQASFINVADSVNGISIGFLSFVKKGFTHLEINNTELFDFNFSFKTGVRHFYNILSVGYDPFQAGIPNWSVAYGIGSEFKLSHKTALNLELSGHHINENSTWTNAVNEVYRMDVNFSWYLAKNFAIYGGPSLNVQVSDWYNSTEGHFLSSIAPYSINVYTNSLKEIQTRMWFGWKFGIRI